MITLQVRHFFYQVVLYRKPVLIIFSPEIHMINLCAEILIKLNE